MVWKFQNEELSIAAHK